MDPPDEEESASARAANAAAAVQGVPPSAAAAAPLPALIPRGETAGQGRARAAAAELSAALSAEHARARAAAAPGLAAATAAVAATAAAVESAARAAAVPPPAIGAPAPGAAAAAAASLFSLPTGPVPRTIRELHRRYSVPQYPTFQRGYDALRQVVDFGGALSHTSLIRENGALLRWCNVIRMERRLRDGASGPAIAGQSLIFHISAGAATRGGNGDGPNDDSNNTNANANEGGDGEGEDGGLLNPERIKMLDDLGFEWKTDMWMERFREFRDWVEENNAQRQQGQGTGEGEGEGATNRRTPRVHPALSRWVAVQRREYDLWQRGNSTRLSDERIQMLHDINFDVASEPFPMPPWGRLAGGRSDGGGDGDGNGDGDDGRGSRDHRNCHHHKRRVVRHPPRLTKLARTVAGGTATLQEIRRIAEETPRSLTDRSRVKPMEPYEGLPLHHAVSNGAPLEIVQYLFEATVDQLEVNEKTEAASASAAASTSATSEQQQQQQKPRPLCSRGGMRGRYGGSPALRKLRIRQARALRRYHLNESLDSDIGNMSISSDDEYCYDEEDDDEEDVFGLLEGAPFGANMVRQSGEWKCEHCASTNPREGDTCNACESAKPGSGGGAAGDDGGDGGGKPAALPEVELTLARAHAAEQEVAAAASAVDAAVERIDKEVAEGMSDVLTAKEDHEKEGKEKPAVADIAGGWVGVLAEAQAARKDGRDDDSDGAVKPTAETPTKKARLIEATSMDTESTEGGKEPAEGGSSMKEGTAEEGKTKAEAEAKPVSTAKGAPPEERKAHSIRDNLGYSCLHRAISQKASLEVVLYLIEVSLSVDDQTKEKDDANDKSEGLPTSSDSDAMDGEELNVSSDRSKNICAMRVSNGRYILHDWVDNYLVASPPGESEEADTNEQLRMVITRALVEAYPKALSECCDGATPLISLLRWKAPTSDRVDSMERRIEGVTNMMISANAKAITVKCASGCNVFHYALLSRRAMPTLRLLLSFAPKDALLVRNNLGEYPLHIATMMGLGDEFALVLNAEPSVARETDGSGRTPLHWVWLQYLQTHDPRRQFMEEQLSNNLQHHSAFRRVPSIKNVNAWQEVSLALAKYVRHEYADASPKSDESAWKPNPERLREFALFWEKVKLLLRTVYCGEIRDREPKIDLCSDWVKAQLHDTELLTVHAAASVSCPRTILRIALILHPAQVRTPDPTTGMLPLHIAASVNSSKEWRVDKKQPSAVAVLADAFPKACSIPTKEGRLPVHLAIDSYKKYGQKRGGTVLKQGTVLKTVIDKYPDAQQLFDHKVGLLPFMLAAEGSVGSLELTFELLQENPQLVKSGIVSCM